MNLPSISYTEFKFESLGFKGWLNMLILKTTDELLALSKTFTYIQTW